MELKRKLTREEKIAQFDELRRNYCAMMKSLKFYEEECSKLTKNTGETGLKPSDIKTEKPFEEVKKENQIVTQERTKAQVKWISDQSTFHHNTTM